MEGDVEGDEDVEGVEGGVEGDVEGVDDVTDLGVKTFFDKDNVREAELVCNAGEVVCKA